MKYFLFCLLVCGCSTAKVTSNCLESVKADTNRLAGEFERKQLKYWEYAEALNDQLSLLSVMELNNHIFRVGGHDYCDADFDDARWDIQQKINFAHSMMPTIDVIK